MPLKVQRLERVLVKNGEWTGYKGNLNTDKENLFPGEYWESTIKGWYGASGSPIFKKNTLKDNSYILLGLLSHTFELEEGRVRTSAIKNDDWGNYTNTAISPAINLSINGELH